MDQEKEYFQNDFLVSNMMLFDFDANDIQTVSIVLRKKHLLNSGHVIR